MQVKIILHFFSGGRQYELAVDNQAVIAILLLVEEGSQSIRCGLTGRRVLTFMYFGKISCSHAWFSAPLRMMFLCLNKGGPRGKCNWLGVPPHVSLIWKGPRWPPERLVLFSQWSPKHWNSFSCAVGEPWVLQLSLPIVDSKMVGPPFPNTRSYYNNNTNARAHPSPTPWNLGCPISYRSSYKCAEPPRLAPTAGSMVQAETIALLGPMMPKAK